ncbi:MAG: hypothetical protein LBJ02_06305 [Bifidobacteriaceae bacterium]|nr:hypothetical protein [Bifidobacteriaceae bacterium]
MSAVVFIVFGLCGSVVGCVGTGSTDGLSSTPSVSDLSGGRGPAAEVATG